MVDVMITLEPGADAGRVVAQLAERGFVLEQDLGAISVLVGRADPAALAALSRVDGVRAVEVNPLMGVSGGQV